MADTVWGKPTMTIEEARAVERPEIVVGQSYTFYAEMEQEHIANPEERMCSYTGQEVVVVRQLTKDESDWFEPYEEDGELIEPDVSRGWIVRASNGFEFPALEEELNGWDHDLGQYMTMKNTN